MRAIASLPLAVILALPAAARAEPAPWTVGVAPRVGVAIPTSKLGAFVIGGVQIDYVPSFASHRVMLGLDLSLTRPGYDGSVMDPRIPGGMGTYAVHETEGVVAVTVAYRFASADHRVVPWLGAGPLLHLLQTVESTSLAPGNNTAISTELGVEVLGGADVRLGPGFLVGGVRYAYSRLAHPLTGSTNAGEVSLELGYRLVF